ncbi:hypothetical protein ONS95_005675 [Cadophora gregata]|uniref:uncharacterized protein n=1 Tax=Cadophora gregata TaxID=51156 RepID=UPI0026DC177C|nr:uncharacterized protein ONS95_005675 [Cadophora gregata]KAK0103664.1 hypothetical protein ONS95_005675 [Cadophora gregata]KAK0107857.1 hypothetical protein ONS96_003647 [Cadophora gregata f. sp. sojae]
MTDKDKKGKGKGKKEDEDEEEAEVRAQDVTNIIMDTEAVNKKVLKLVGHPPSSHTRKMCHVLTSAHTSAKTVSRSPEPIHSNGIVSVPMGVCAILFNKYSEGVAQITTRYETVRTGPADSGWYVIAVDEGDDIMGFAQFYYYYKL